MGKRLLTSVPKLNFSRPGGHGCQVKAYGGELRLKMEAEIHPVGMV